MSSPLSSPSWRGSPWARGACFSCVCVLLLTALPARAPAQTARPPALESSIELLRKADATLTDLETSFAARSAELRTLQASLQRAGTQLAELRLELASLQERLAASESSRGELSRELAAMQSSFGELTSRYAALSSSWSVYREETLRQAASRERALKAWRIAAVVAPVVGLVLGYLLRTRTSTR